MTDDRYNRPEPGTADWHGPLNETFADLETAVFEVVVTRDDLRRPEDVAARTPAGRRRRSRGRR